MKGGDSMQNIRKDMTSGHALDKSQTWEEQTLRGTAMTDQELKKQEELTEIWSNISKNKNLRPAEIAELELQRRISAATEGDTSANRTETRIKEHKASEKLDTWYRGQTASGQTEDEFIKEMQGQSERYSDAWTRAKKASGL